MITATQYFLLVVLSAYFGASTGLFFILAGSAYRGREYLLLAFMSSMYGVLIATCVIAAQDILKAT